MCFSGPSYVMGCYRFGHQKAVCARLYKGRCYLLERAQGVVLHMMHAALVSA